MTKKDNEKDSDRPHYYSQFWLDIAAGRRTIGGPRSDEDEPLEDISEPIAPTAPITTPRRAARNGQEHSSAFDGQREQHEDEEEAPFEAPRARATAEPVAFREEVHEPELEQEPEAEAPDFPEDTIGDLDLQEAAVEDADIPDMDLEEPVEDEDEEEEFFDDEEDEDEWSAGRGRKKNKPTRPTKPVTKQRPRREPRRSGF
jgi:hypothetical protein